MPEEKVESIKGLALTADGKGAVFDVAAEDLDSFLAGIFRFLYMINNDHAKDIGFLSIASPTGYYLLG